MEHDKFLTLNLLVFNPVIQELLSICFVLFLNLFTCLAWEELSVPAKFERL